MTKINIKKETVEESPPDGDYNISILFTIEILLDLSERKVLDFL